MEAQAAFRKTLDEAADDKRSRAARENVCRQLALVFREAGHQLWVYGHLIGGDRVAGDSPFDFGSDGLVGLSTVTQIGGELLSGANALLDQDNSYGAAALIRQMVEVEYLAWAFAEDPDEATTWLRSQRDERLKMWQPRHLRERSQGRFRGSDYRHHCEFGGHPTPTGMVLLPCHARGPAVERYEIALHGTSAWEYVSVAAERFGYGEQVRSVAEATGLTEAIGAWREDDRLWHIRKPDTERFDR
ncbi:hypothetical protein [Conexibacter sp. CPCC 206217]|uniref:hypothetical protein n=1 Tax=Conexibacter sp. CPCC 206217 TaxID=3064574 RepID=UPI0027273872|nr:hypothetical protein [Conexibacter sp. CPCC 206217]MDO8213468.1 hypothetical protein [Conexibacter sp. CPCC 206217]